MAKAVNPSRAQLLESAHRPDSRSDNNGNIMSNANDKDYLLRRIELLEHTIETLRASREAPALFMLNNEDLRALSDHMPDQLMLLSPDGVILYCNHTIANLQLSQVIGKRVHDFIDGDNQTIFEDALQRANLSQQPVHYEINVSFAARTHHMFTRLIPMLEQGRVEKILAIVTDVSQQHETQQQLLLSQQHLRLMIESTPLAAIVWDRNYRTIEWNSAAEAIFGWRRDEALGVEFTRLIVPPQEWNTRLRQFDDAIACGAIEKYPPYANQTKSGELIICEWWSNTVKNAQGETIGIASFAQDVTQKLAAERELQLAKAQAESSARAKSLFLANMSHEIRTPLNGIIGLLELTQDQPMSPSLADTLQLIQQSTQILLGVVNDILDFSKIENDAIVLEQAALDINAVLHNVHALMQPLAHKKQLQFSLAPLPAQQGWIIGDAKYLNQIIGNLVANAVKFTDQGSVHIAAQITRDDNTSGELVVAVTDTGIGIAADKLDHVFRDFAQQDETITRRFGGSGLGLTISQRLARLMNGSIEVDSTPAHGSQFRLRLPIRFATAQTGKATRHAILVRNYAASALLVDDNPINLQVAEKMLQRLGIRVTALLGGAEAIALLQQEQRFDIMLLDIQMPELDGISVCRHVRAQGIDVKRLPIIAITANVLAEERQRCLDAGMNGFIGKPFTLAQLVQALDPWLL